MLWILVVLSLLSSCSPKRFLKGNDPKQNTPAGPSPTADIIRERGQPIPSTDALVPGKSEKPNTNPNTSPPVDMEGDSEQPTPPARISGAFLHCANLSTATDEIPVSSVACRLDDDQGNRIDPNDRNAKAAYTIGSVPASVTVNQKTLTYSDRTFDSLFEFRAANKQLSLQAASSSVVTVNLVDLASNQSIGELSGAIAEIKLDGRGGAWSRLVESNNTIIIDSITSLVWGVDDGKGYTYDEGIRRCEGLTYAGRSSWRLPSIDELRIARDHGFGAIHAEPANMNVNSNRFGVYRSVTLEFPNQPIVAGSRVWNLDLALPKPQGPVRNPVENKGSVICVHD